MDAVITIILFIAVLGVLVLVHEIGHFLAARIFGVAVDEFGVGFPPRLWFKKIGKTEYSLNAIPVGGFVRLKGVAGDERLQEKPSADADSFSVQRFWKRFLILFAGIGMNIVLAACFFTLMLWSGVRMSLDEEEMTHATDQELTVSYLLPEGPAQQAQMQLGDSILSIDGVSVSSVDTFRSIVQQSDKTSVTIRVKRDSQELDVVVAPQLVDVDGEQLRGIGVGLLNTGIVHYGFFDGVVEGVSIAYRTTVAICIGFADLIKSLFVHDTQVDVQLSGPVGIAVMTREFAQAGIASLLQFCGVLSLNLAVFNLLPFPMLDGGRIFFLAIEAVRRKPASHQFEARVHQIGFFILFGLLIYVTAKDIFSLF